LGSEQAQRAKAVTTRQVEQLTRIVDDLLDVTRVLRGKLQIKRRPLELGELMRRTVEDHRLLTANAGLELDVRLPPRPLWVDGDPARLAQAIGNLLANATKFTSRGGHILVALEESAAPFGMAVQHLAPPVIISVRFGPSMHPALLRCSSVAYVEYTPSSRLAWRAPERPKPGRSSDWRH
jgi:signal transduction histidine kinase